MRADPANRLWQRILDGRHTLLFGRLPELPMGEHVLVLRVDCSETRGALDVISEARGRAARMLELAAGRPVFGQARATFGNLGRRLLDEVSEPDPCGPLVDTLNELARIMRPAALALERVETADIASLRALSKIVARAGWLRLPLILQFGTREVSGEPKTLFELVESSEGGEAVIVSLAETTVAAALPTDLPLEILRVLRAAAVIGANFEAHLVARLLGVDDLSVLYALQAARDAGLPVEDLGAGRFRLPEATLPALRLGIMPSLNRAWHQRLSHLLAERAPLPPDRPREPSRPTARPSAPEWAEPTRAARHAEAAFDTDLAVEQYVAAARRAVAAGAYERAQNQCQRGLELLERAEPTTRRRLLGLSALLVLAKIKTESVIDGTESSLEDALELLGECSAQLLPGDPPELGAEIAAAKAAVYYDIGDEPALRSVLAELSQASRALLAAGSELEAARLLNDEAAVRVRLGEIEQARTLLGNAREIFAGRAANDEGAALELAEAEHLLARLGLHQPTHGDRTRRLAAYIEHARRAEQLYLALGHDRDVGRVRETLGRLEMAAGAWNDALQHLMQAADSQRATADVIGLARTSAALAEIATNAGDFSRAFELISDSVELNHEKGSALGIAFNRRALEALVRKTGAQAGPLAELAAQVLERLQAAEHDLGRVPLAASTEGPRPTPAFRDRR